MAENTNGITMGQVLEALNNKADIDLENTPMGGGDYVVEYKLSTAEDPNWYRLYKSGWLEQGGTMPASNRQLTYPKPFANTNYTIICTATTTNNGTWHSIIQSKTESGAVLTVGQYGTSGTTHSDFIHEWIACGQSKK